MTRTRNEVKLMIIENFINHAFTNETMRDALNDVASAYVDEDHVDEFNSLDDQYDFSKIDWHDLREQKSTILGLQEYFGVDSLISKNIEGLLSLIDSIQDHAVDVLGYDEKVVFDGLNKDKTVFSCSVCGSTDVEVKKWVNPNNNNVKEGAAFDEDDIWCNDCQDHNELNEN